MDWFQTIAAEVDARRLRLILKGELRQREVEDPIVFQGVAHIDQDVDGALALHFVCESVTGPFDAEEGLADAPQGKITAEHFYFDLTGIDGEARLWIAERIHLRLDRPSESWGFSTKPDGFDVALGQIPELVTKHATVSNNNERSHETWIVQGQVPSPRQVFPKSWTHQEENGVSWSIDHDKQGNTEISFHGSADGFDVASRHFFRGLSILSSRHLQPKCAATIVNGVERISIFSRRKEVPPPAILWIPPQFKSGWKLFLVAWLAADRPGDSRKMEADDRVIQDVIYHYWYRSYRAYAVDIENGAQVLTSSIEGMTKRYFAEVPDERFTERMKALGRSKETLQKLDRKEHRQAVDILTGKIDEQRRKNPDIIILLDTLVGNKYATIQMKAAWKNIRNNAAHGDHLVTGSDDIARFEPDFFQCFEMFKRLCVIAIGYDGPVQDFSVEGWPVIRYRIPEKD